MFLNVIDIEILLHLATVRTGISGIREDRPTQMMPRQGVIPLPHVTIRAGVLTRHGMRGTAARRDEGGTTGIRAGT